MGVTTSLQPIYLAWGMSRVNGSFLAWRLALAAATVPAHFVLL